MPQGLSGVSRGLFRTVPCKPIGSKEGTESPLTVGTNVLAILREVRNSNSASVTLASATDLGGGSVEEQWFARQKLERGRRVPHSFSRRLLLSDRYVCWNDWHLASEQEIAEDLRHFESFCGALCNCRSFVYSSLRKPRCTRVLRNSALSPMLSPPLASACHDIGKLVIEEQLAWFCRRFRSLSFF